MPKTKNQNSVVTTARPPTSTLAGPTPIGPQVPAEYPAPLPATVPGGWNEGDSEGMTAEDFSIPKLSLKHAVDSRFEDVKPGLFVWHMGEDYAALKPPLAFIPIKSRRGYVQQVDQSSGEQPIICWSKEEMEAEHNGSTEYNRPDKTKFSPLADLMILLIDAKGLPPNAPLVSVGKKLCAPVIYRVKSTSFEVARALNSSIMAAKFRREVTPKFWDTSWILNSTTKSRSGTGSVYQAPTVKLGAPTSAAERLELAEIASNL